MSDLARALRQILETDRLFGVEAMPRARWPRPEEPAAAVASPRPVVAPPVRPVSAGTPAESRRPASSLPPPIMSPTGEIAWNVLLEAPLGQAPSAAPPARLDVLFVGLEWGPPLAGETRALFDRQVAAMKLSPAAVGLLRMVWPGAAEPDAAALATAKARTLAALADHAPRAVVLLGGFSAKAVVGAASLMLARGRWFTVEAGTASHAACATWHPSQLGVDRDRRMQTWEDLQKVMAKLG